MMKSSFLIRSFLLVLISILACSCQSNQATKSDSAGLSNQDSATLAYELASQRWCTNDQACAMMLLLVDDQDNNKSFDARLAALQSKGLVEPGWFLAANDPVNKGTLGYMLYRALDLEGGVIIQLLPLRRYGYREVVHAGLMLRGSEYEPLTGPEVVGIMGRAARLMER